MDAQKKKAERWSAVGRLADGGSPQEAWEDLAPQDGARAKIQEQHLSEAEDRLQPWGRAPRGPGPAPSCE